MINGLDLICSGETGAYDYQRKKYRQNILTSIQPSAPMPEAQLYVTRECPGQEYSALLQAHYNSACLDTSYDDQDLEFFRDSFCRDYINNRNENMRIKITAPPSLLAQMNSVNGRPHIFITNFKGIEGGKGVVPASEADLTIEIPENSWHMMYFLPFLGKTQPIKITGTQIQVPAVKTGAVVWFD